MNENPLKSLRLSYGLTQDELAHRANVARNLVIRNEQGLYPLPSPALLDYFFPSRTNFLDYRSQRRRLIEDYHEWQTAHRKSSYGVLVEPPQYPFAPTTNLLTQLIQTNNVLPTNAIPHPFVYWRELSGLNLTQVCKAFCIHQGVMHKFENQSHLVESLPEPLVSALLESGYDRQTISNLTRWYSLYKTSSQQRALILINSPTVSEASEASEEGLREQDKPRGDQAG